MYTAADINIYTTLIHRFSGGCRNAGSHIHRQLHKPEKCSRVRSGGCRRARGKWRASLPAGITLLFLLLILLPDTAFGVERFPKPEFESGYQLLTPTRPPPRHSLFEYLDCAVLAAALGAASYFALKRRSRKGIFTVMVFSLLYFGFWRKGCVCSVGSIQNIARGLFDPGYTVPVTVLIFFLLPLVAALLFGRTFCAAVCPLGAVQDLVVIKPLKVPTWLSAVLGFFPYMYLALSLLFAATASSFIICRYDPFISLFRLNGSMAMIVLGICFLLLGTVIARPYCRFSCPYGVLLNWLSRLSRRHMTITPGECIQCRLCADSCPFDAIRTPSAVPAAAKRAHARKLLLLLVVLFPFMLGLGGLVGYGVAPMLAQVHPMVRLAEQVAREDDGLTRLTTTESEAFRASGKTKKDLYTEVNTIQRHYATGSTITGVFLGSVAAGILIGLTVFRSRTVFEPDKGACISCGRCFAYCPVKPDTEITNPDVLQGAPG